MDRRGAIDFEEVVELPESPTDAARVYLGVMAYPERGAGQPGKLGNRFGEALGQYVLWNRRKAHGLNDLRLLLNDPNFNPPRLRSFEGALERGRKRLVRRFAAFDIVGNQLINGLLNASHQANRIAATGKPEDAFVISPGASFTPIRTEIWEAAMAIVYLT